MKVTFKMPTREYKELLLQPPFLTPFFSLNSQQWRHFLPVNALAMARKSGRKPTLSFQSTNSNSPVSLPALYQTAYRDLPSLSSSILCGLPAFLSPVHPLGLLTPLPFYSIPITVQHFLKPRNKFYLGTKDPHLVETQKPSLPGNTQPPHFPKNQKGQWKPRNGKPSQQRQDQMSAPRIAITPNPDA